MLVPLLRYMHKFWKLATPFRETAHIKIAQIRFAHQNFPFRRFDHSEQSSRDGGLSGSGSPDDSGFLPGLDHEGDIVQHQIQILPAIATHHLGIKIQLTFNSRYKNRFWTKVQL